METKPLLYGIVGFILGGLLVSVAATIFNSPTTQTNSATHTGTTMDDNATELQTKTGDAYDKAFIAAMIEHHEGAVAMAKLSATNAKHDEIKQLSQDIIAAQEKEIATMKQWRTDWNYASSDSTNTKHQSMH